MLEIKDATFAVATDRKMRNLSFVANNGEVTAITGRGAARHDCLQPCWASFL